MKRFDLETYNRLVAEGKTPKIVTRSGKNVRILCTNVRGDYPVIGAISDNEVSKEKVYSYTKEGIFLCEETGSIDLFFADTEPTYRPYKDAEECFKDVVKHGGWVKEKNTTSYFHLTRIYGGGVCYTKDVAVPLQELIDENVWVESFQELLDGSVWADDGSPCGVKEEEI